MLARTAVRSVGRARLSPALRSAQLQRRRGYATDDTQISFNLTTPHSSLMLDEKVNLVTVPGSAGYFGIAPDHVPTVSEIKPGLVTIEPADGKAQHYFVSGGFVFVHENSTVDLSVLEAVPVDQIDPNLAKAGADTFQKQLSSAKDDLEIAKAQIGLETSEAMLYAIETAK